MNCFAEDGIMMPGFGNQPILVEKDPSSKLLIQKILGNISYKLTPGDTYNIVIKMDDTFSQPLILDENYKLELPFIGTMDVKGMYFSELRQEIIQRIKAERVVDFVDFSLVAPALFEVFIYGGVESPGFATVTPINTLWELIVFARGFKQGGSYRQIHLARNGKTQTIDLGKYIREGDLEHNPRLEPGDRIYVPHTQVVTEIKGEVLYPDTFELLPGETLFDLIQMAGGYTPVADRSLIEISRIHEDGSLNIKYVKHSEAPQFSIQNGDIVFVKSALENKEMLIIEGALYGKPTTGTEPQKIPDKSLVFSIPYIQGSTLLQILEKFGGPSPLADAEKSIINRDTTGETLYVDVRALWNTRNPELNVTLEPRDHIIIPMKKTMVIVAGEVNNAGVFPFQSSSIVSDYIKLAGGIDFEKGDPNSMFFIDNAGKKTRITLETRVLPGSLIFVDRNSLEKTTFVVGRVSIIVGLISSIITIILNTSDIYTTLKN